MSKAAVLASASSRRVSGTRRKATPKVPTKKKAALRVVAGNESTPRKTLLLPCGCANAKECFSKEVPGFVLDLAFGRHRMMTDADRHPEAVAKQAAADIFRETGDLSGIRVTLNQILLAIYKAPEITKGGIIRVDSVKDEDIYQGVSALVVKMGPHCYEQTANMDFTWHEDEIANVGDWVMFRRGEGLRVNVNGRECILMLSERGIKLILDRPDRVY